MSDSGESPLLTSEDFILTPDFSPEDYKTKWSPLLTSTGEENDFEERNKVLEKFYDYIFKLLFGKDASAETRKRAVDLLDAQRGDAAYFNPFMYNDWIRNVKNEIIKRELFDLWRSEFVTKGLGLIYAKESDYFDDLDDPEPAEFYKLP